MHAGGCVLQRGVLAEHSLVNSLSYKLDYRSLRSRKVADQAMLTQPVACKVAASKSQAGYRQQPVHLKVSDHIAALGDREIRIVQCASTS